MFTLEVVSRSHSHSPDRSERRDAQPGGTLNFAVGLQTGTIGGLVMLLWLALIAPVLGHPWWLVWNGFASGLYRDAITAGWGLATITGAALHLAGSGIIGALNALFSPGGRLFGLFLTAIWYLLCYLLVWKKLSPQLMTPALQPLLIFGYFLLGSVLGQHANLLARARS